MEPAKTREWTEEETKLLIELAQRKERVPAMARELGRHIASIRRRAPNWVCFCRKAAVRGSFSFFSRLRDAAGCILCQGRRTDIRCCPRRCLRRMKRLTGLVGEVRPIIESDPPVSESNPALITCPHCYIGASDERNYSSNTVLKPRYTWLQTYVLLDRKAALCALVHSPVDMAHAHAPAVDPVRSRTLPPRRRSAPPSGARRSRRSRPNAHRSARTGGCGLRTPTASCSRRASPRA